MNRVQKHQYRKGLAWIGFVAVFLGAPIALAILACYVSQLGISVAHYDRPGAFYQQTSEQRP